MTEREIFFEALEIGTPEARAAYLLGACRGEVVLRRKVDELLKEHFSNDSLLAEPSLVEEPPTLKHDLPPQEAPAQMLGRYKLLEKIGEGGFGEVWMAEQREPIKRRVALKIIKLGMDSRQIVNRFAAERQALAMMDHPNIAKIFDAGTTESTVAAGVSPAVEPGVPPGGNGAAISNAGEGSRPTPGGRMPPSTAGETPAATLSAGRPYFVMELVRGIKITEYCDQNQLPTRERLRLFILVCQAIQHAHQKGIIHRDIKPSNILVTLHDGVPVPKVIDFGIAKATQQELTDQTVFTQFQQFMGTPAYISPEQAEMSGLDIDTRADIYSLGVLLYELLVGQTPFDAREMMQGGLDALRQIIREREPLRPSTKLNTLADDARVTAGQRRQTEVGKLVHQLQGDLDWIVMKCLEKDRTRRYETANELGMDLQRHLSHEPVVARPPSGPYRLRKFVHRNKGAFTAALALAVVLLMGVIASTSQAIRATRAERKQTGLRQQAETSNRDLRDTVSLLELQRAEEFLRANDSVAGVAQLAALLRRDPSNHIAASRLVSALVHRNWALPTASPLRHLEPVPIVSFSPDGRHVLSASWDKTAQISDASTGKSLAIVRHKARILSARYNPAGTCFVTASADGTARIWSATNGTALTPPLRHDDTVYWAEFSSDGQSIVTASADKTARIWETASGALKLKLSGRATYVILARFSPDGARVATGGDLGSVRMWSAKSGEMLFRVENRVKPLAALAFSPDGRWLVSACEDGIARLWNATNGQPIGNPLTQQHALLHAVFSPDSRLLLTTSEDGTARLWNATNGFPTGQPLPHDGGVTYGEFSPDGMMVVTTSKDNSARLWDVRTGMPLCQPLREREAILHAGFSPDGRRLVTGSWDQNVQVWNIQPRRYLAIGMRHEKRVTTVAFDPGGESVLSASVDQTARLWNARTGQALVQPMRHQAAVRSADYSADGRRIVTASEDSTACVWDSTTGQMIAGPLQHAKTVWSAHFSPDGERVATASADGTARVWDARTGEPVTPPLEHGAVVAVARFSPDGRWVVTGSENRSARVWDAQTGQPVTERLQHIDHVEWAEFSPDGQRVVSASSDNTARIWEVRTGKPIGSPLQHARTVQKAVFSPDGRRVATASLDRTARVWDASTGEALTNPLTHDKPVSQVCFSPDGRRILTSSWSGTSRLWDANTGRPLTEWLDAGGPGFSVCFDSTGRHIVSGTYNGIVRMWDTPPAPTPVPPWFLVLAEAVAGTRLSARGNTELVSRRELEEAARQLARVSEGGFYERLGRWFLADPSQRSLSPF